MSSLTSAPARERTPLGIALVTGTVLLVPVLFTAAAVHGSPWRFGLPAAAVAVFAALTDDVAASAGFVLVTALLVDGFLLGSGGTLTWSGGTDARRAVVLVAAAVVGLAVRSAHDAVVERR